MRFYLMANPYLWRRERSKYNQLEYAKSGHDSEVTQCKANPSHINIGKRTKTLYVRLRSSVVGDFMWAPLSECLVTERVKKIFEEENVSGYLLNPVVIDKVYKTYYDFRKFKFEEEEREMLVPLRERNARPIPNFLELVVLGEGGEADPKSGISLVSKCPACGKMKFTGVNENGLIVDESKWDGSDIFNVFPLSLFKIVTGRVKEIAEKNNLTNVVFVPTEEIRIKDISDGYKWTERNQFLPDGWIDPDPPPWLKKEVLEDGRIKVKFKKPRKINRDKDKK
jgi:hypothetical protein